MATSAELLDACLANGLLSKQAADEVAAVRLRLIKQALQKEAASWFSRLRGGADDVAKKVVQPPLSLLEKLRTGGATGVKEVAEGAGRLSPGWSDVGLNLAKMLALSAMTAGATAGVQGLLRHSRDKQVDNDIQSSYAQLYDVHPNLKDVEETKPGLVASHFGVLARYAPTLAADPLVAGTWLTASTMSRNVAPGEVKMLAEAQASIDEMNEQRRGSGRPSPIKAGEFATKAMGV